MNNQRNGNAQEPQYIGGANGQIATAHDFLAQMEMHDLIMPTDDNYGDVDLYLNDLVEPHMSEDFLMLKAELNSVRQQRSAVLCEIKKVMAEMIECERNYSHMAAELVELSQDEGALNDFLLKFLK